MGISVANRFSFSWIVALIGLSAGGAMGSPLNLDKRLPDIYSGSIVVGYDAATDQFTADGFPGTYDLDGIAPADWLINNSARKFELKLTIDETGNASAGSLLITGRVFKLNPDLSTTELVPFGDLLTGTLAPGQFGYPTGSGDIFEFVFDVTGGALASAFGPQAGVILNAPGANFNGTFTSSFGNTGGASADTFAVPLPAALPAGLALLGVVALRRIAKRLR